MPQPQKPYLSAVANGRLLTVKEIAELLCIGVPATRARIAKVGLHPVRLVGTTQLYDYRAVLAIANVNPGYERRKKPRPA